MTTDRDFDRDLRAIERRSIESASVVKIDPLASILDDDGMAFCRVVSFPFLEEPEDPLIRMRDILAGLHGIGNPVAGLLISKPRETAFYLAHGHNSVGKGEKFLESALQGSYPGIELGPAEPGDGILKAALKSATHWAVLMGTPGRIGEGLAAPPAWEAGINRVIRSLRGRAFGLLVVSHPVPDALVESGIDAISKELDATHPLIKYSVQFTATSREQRVRETIDTKAELYCDALRGLLERLQTGRRCGLWGTLILLMAEEKAGLLNLGGLVKASFAGDNPVLEPLRVVCADAHKGDSLDGDSYPLKRLLPRSYMTLHHSLDLAQFLTPPTIETPGYDIVKRPAFGLHQPHLMSGGNSVFLGEVTDRKATMGVSCHIAVDELTKHGLIAGVTGSGKTNTCFHILSQLWKDGGGVPFLVLEPAKTEYRRILSRPGFEEGLIFTLGDETVSPFRLNPFDFPAGVSVQSHLDQLRAVFNASFVMYSPMPQVLEKCIHRIYEDKGWDLISGSNRVWPDPDAKQADAYPTLTDLYESIDQVVEELGYDEKISRDVKAAMKIRIGSLRLGGKGAMLDTRKSLPVEEILSRPTVLELEKVSQDEEKAFLIALIVLKIFEYRRAHHDIGSAGRLVHVTLIEEAHRLLARAPAVSGNPESADPKAKAVESLCQMLSEIRAYGEGILIAEQIPVKLAEDALKNTNLKISHRLVAQEDRDSVGGTMAMNDEQRSYLSVIDRGDAVAFFEGLDEPMAIRIPYAIPRPCTELDVASFMKDKIGCLDGCFERKPGCRLCPDKCRHFDLVQRALSGAKAPLEYFPILSTLVCSPERWEAVMASANEGMRTRSTRVNEYCFWINSNWKHLRATAGFLGCEPAEIVSLHHRFCRLAAAACGIEALGTIEDAGRLSIDLRRALSREHGPFRGCDEYCGEKCIFGYEMRWLIDNSDVMRRIGEVFRSSSGRDRLSKQKENVSLCAEYAGRVIFRYDPLTVRKAGLCLFIQVLDRYSVRNVLSDVREWYLDIDGGASS